MKNQNVTESSWQNNYYSDAKSLSLVTTFIYAVCNWSTATIKIIIIPQLKEKEQKVKCVKLSDRIIK